MRMEKSILNSSSPTPTRRQRSNAPLSDGHAPTDFADLPDSACQSLVENSPDAMFVVVGGNNDESEARVVFCNPAALRVLGAAASQVIGKSPLEFVTPTGRARWSQGFSRLLKDGLSGNLASGADTPPVIQKWLRIDGVPVTLEVSAASFTWQGRPALQLSARDVTALRRRSNERRRSAERLALAVEAAGLATWEWDIGADALVGNAWHYRLLGLEPDSEPLAYETTMGLVHPDDRMAVGETLMSALHLGHEFQTACRIIRPDGTLRWVRTRGRVIERDTLGHARRMSGVSIDITEQCLAREALQRAHDEMEFHVRERTGELSQLNEKLQQEVSRRRQLEATRRNLLRRLVTSQEDERRRLSRELHDQLGQNLVALMLGLKNLPELLASPEPEASTWLAPPLIEQLHRLQGLTAVLMEQVHHLAWELRPAALDNLGLEAALRQFVEQWQKESGIATEFVSSGFSGEKRLPWPIETALYRAVQEALLNVQKHAGARHVSVLLEKHSTEIIAIIEDDGSGFQVEDHAERLATGNAERLGLIGLHERLEQVGGSADIESAPGQGTTVFLRAPTERRQQPRTEP